MDVTESVSPDEPGWNPPPDGGMNGLPKANGVKVVVDRGPALIRSAAWDTWHLRGLLL